MLQTELELSVSHVLRSLKARRAFSLKNGTKKEPSAEAEGSDSLNSLPVVQLQTFLKHRDQLFGFIPVEQSFDRWPERTRLGLRTPENEVDDILIPSVDFNLDCAMLEIAFVRQAKLHLHQPQCFEDVVGRIAERLDDELDVVHQQVSVTWDSEIGYNFSYPSMMSSSRIPGYSSMSAMRIAISIFGLQRVGPPRRVTLFPSTRGLGSDELLDPLVVEAGPGGEPGKVAVLVGLLGLGKRLLGRLDRRDRAVLDKLLPDGVGRVRGPLEPVLLDQRVDRLALAELLRGLLEVRSGDQGEPTLDDRVVAEGLSERLPRVAVTLTLGRLVALRSARLGRATVTCCCHDDYSLVDTMVIELSPGSEYRGAPTLLGAPLPLGLEVAEAYEARPATYRAPFEFHFRLRFEDSRPTRARSSGGSRPFRPTDRDTLLRLGREVKGFHKIKFRLRRSLSTGVPVMGGTLSTLCTEFSNNSIDSKRA